MEELIKWYLNKKIVALLKKDNLTEDEVVLQDYFIQYYLERFGTEIEPDMN